MVSHCTVGLLVLGSQRDEERGKKSRGGRGRRWTGKAAFNLALTATSQLSEGDAVCARGCLRVCVCAYVCVAACLCRRVYAAYMSKHFWRSEPAGSTVVSGAAALGDEADRVKTHHNTAVIFP